MKRFLCTVFKNTFINEAMFMWNVYHTGLTKLAVTIEMMTNTSWNFCPTLSDQSDSSI